MLAGKPAFDGEDVPDILSRILQREPDWSLLPANLPPRIRELLRLCLEKNAKNRRRDAGDVQMDIQQAKSAPAIEAAASLPQPRNRKRVLAERGISAAAGIILTGFVIWAVLHFSTPKPVPVSRFAIVPATAERFTVQGADRDIAISPDGNHIVYRIGETGQAQIAIRSLDQLDAHPLPGIAGVRWPFISPNSRWIGFFTGPSGELRKVSLNGGSPITLCRMNGAPRGASWSPDGTIVFATNDTSAGLMTVSEGGGEPKVLTRPDKAAGEVNHFFPAVLPGGRAVLFTIVIAGQPIENAQIAVFDLKTGRKKVLIRGGSQPEYVETGHIIYAAAGTLRAVRFDPERLQVLSDPAPVAEQVMTAATGAANFAVAQNGTLLYVPGSAGTGAGPQRTLVWVNRQGRDEPISAPARTYAQPRISPDGTRVALEIRDQENDIWIWDLARQTPTRLTFDPGVDQFPVWTPDGRRIIFTSGRNGIGNLYWQAADNTGSVERLTTNPNLQRATSISPDGKHVLLVETTPAGGNDINLLTMDEKKSVTPLVHTPYREFNGEISPDGRWLAYESSESAVNQVYVRPFPNAEAGHWQISTAGGTRPLWARNGRELFYVGPDSKLMVVPVVVRGENFIPGNPTKVFDVSISTSSPGRTYDISPDGQRFLLIKENSGAEQASTTPASMIVVLNWLEELKTRTGAK
jgi:serine/threonine-protein kinase